jgi:hypothetical protein
VAALIDLIAVNSRKLGEFINHRQRKIERIKNVLRSLRNRALEKPFKGLDHDIELKYFGKNEKYF